MPVASSWAGQSLSCQGQVHVEHQRRFAAVAGAQLATEGPVGVVELRFVHDPVPVGAELDADSVIQGAHAARVAQAAAEDLGAEQLAVVAGGYAKDDALAVGCNDLVHAQAKPNG